MKPGDMIISRPGLPLPDHKKYQYGIILGPKPEETPYHFGVIRILWGDGSIGLENEAVLIHYEKFER